MKEKIIIGTTNLSVLSTFFLNETHVTTNHHKDRNFLSKTRSFDFECKGNIFQDGTQIDQAFDCRMPTLIGTTSSIYLPLQFNCRSQHISAEVNIEYKLLRNSLGFLMKLSYIQNNMTFLGVSSYPKTKIRFPPTFKSYKVFSQSQFQPRNMLRSLYQVERKTC